ncbi:hypothetical protein PIROE2DRAFT_60314 [Piromyces sp. E2]|nr:hypothetical protein PIROE2DRAFT_60314 [Piromyces sp. E2]|eukprot:OUM64949.1 hypothetical protein PIROE2DRAFT_60314 [Piromyces sp. E2]
MIVFASPVLTNLNDTTDISDNTKIYSASGIEDKLISESDSDFDNGDIKPEEDINVIEDEDEYYYTNEKTVEPLNTYNNNNSNGNQEDINNEHNTIDWSIYTVENVNNMTTEYMEHYNTVLKQIEEIPDDECSFENVIAVIGNELGNKNKSFELMIDILQYMFPDKDVRDAASNAFLVLSDFEIENYKGNTNLYHKIAMVNENIKNGKFKAPTEHEDIVLLERINAEFKSFSLEEEPQVVFTKDELEGVPEEYFENYENTSKDGQEAYNVGLDYSLGSVAKNDTTRKVVREAIERQCKSNVDVLREITNIR